MRNLFQNTFKSKEKVIDQNAFTKASITSFLNKDLCDILLILDFLFS